MDGVFILVIALCSALGAAALWYTVRVLQRLEALPKRRVPERVVYEADWNRIMVMTQLKESYNTQPKKGADISE